MKIKQRKINVDRRGKGGVEGIVAIVMVVIVVTVSFSIIESLSPPSEGVVITSHEIRIASDFATSGNGTSANPYIGGIQEAIDDLPKVGGEVYCASAFFDINSTIKLNKTIFLHGAALGWASTSYPGYGAVIRISDDASGNWDMINISADSNSAADRIFFTRLSMLNLYGNKDNAAGVHSAIMVYDWATDLLFDRLGIGYFSGYGFDFKYIHLHSLSDIWIEGCTQNGINCVDPTMVGITPSFRMYNVHISDGSYMGAYFSLENIDDVGLIISSCSFGNNLRQELSLYYVDKFKIEGCYFYDTHDTYQQILIAGKPTSKSQFGLVSNCIINGSQYGIYFNGYTEYIEISNCIINGSSINSIGFDAYNNYITITNNILTNGINMIGTNPNGLITNNLGYATENSGIATITNGDAHITVTHGMDVTPTSITVTGNHSEVSSCWVTNITSTQFDIWVSNAVTYDRVVYWYAEG